MLSFLTQSFGTRLSKSFIFFRVTYPVFTGSTPSSLGCVYSNSHPSSLFPLPSSLFPLPSSLFPLPSVYLSQGFCLLPIALSVIVREKHTYSNICMHARTHTHTYKNISSILYVNDSECVACLRLTMARNHTASTWPSTLPSCTSLPRWEATSPNSCCESMPSQWWWPSSWATRPRRTTWVVLLVECIILVCE